LNCRIYDLFIKTQNVLIGGRLRKSTQFYWNDLTELNAHF